MSTWVSSSYLGIVWMIGLSFEIDRILLPRPNDSSTLGKLRAWWVVALPVALEIAGMALEGVVPKNAFSIVFGVPVATAVVLVPLYGKYRDAAPEYAESLRRATVFTYGAIGGVIPPLINLTVPLVLGFWPRMIGPGESWTLGEGLGAALVVIGFGLLGGLASSVVYDHLPASARHRGTLMFVGCTLPLICILYLNLLGLHRQ